MNKLWSYLKDSFIELLESAVETLRCLAVFVCYVLLLPLLPVLLVNEYTSIITWYRYHFTQYYQKNMNERTIRYSLKLTKKTRNNSIKCKLERKWVCRIIKRYRKEEEK